MRKVSELPRWEGWRKALAQELRVLLVIAALANLLVILVIPAPLPGSSPFGASGVVYGLIGAMIGLALVNVPYYARALRITNKPDRLAIILFATNLTLCSLLFGLLFS